MLFEVTLYPYNNEIDVIISNVRTNMLIVKYNIDMCPNVLTTIEY